LGGTYGAGVVDQNVEVPGLPGHLVCGGGNGCVVGHVQLDVVRAEFAGGVLAALRVAGTEVDPMAATDQSACGLIAQAFVAPGDQSIRHGSSLAAASTRLVVGSRYRSAGGPADMAVPGHNGTRWAHPPIAADVPNAPRGYFVVTVKS
jgi:hypothetical protein